jgi:hypothetical protein
MERQRIVPFQRGAMTFEDYNYDLFNKWVLVNPKDEEEWDKNTKCNKKRRVISNDRVFEPTEGRIGNFIKEEYDHDAISDLTD